MPFFNFFGHARSIIKAFFFYRRGFLYLYMRYIVAPRILEHPRPLERLQTRDDLSMHMLFGKRDFLMALWSLASLYRVLPDVGELVVHSDGTLENRHIRAIRKLFPHARIENTKTFITDHVNLLNDYPALKRFRETYTKFQSKKLIDHYILSGKPTRLLLDSDILWFREPKEVIEAIQSKVPEPLMMTNQDARVHVEFADGSQTSDGVARANSGIVVYREDQFSLAEVERYVQKTDYLSKKFTDQACFASVLKPALLPEDTYIIKGTLTGEVVMRHYTAPQREKFFLYGLNRIWKDILGTKR